MKRLFIVMTYYQLVVSIQMALTTDIETQKSTDIFITDNSGRSDEIAERLESLKLFGHVKCIPYKMIDTDKNIFDRMKTVIELNLLPPGKNRYIEAIQPVDNNYDELWFYNNSLLIYGLYDYYYRTNKNIKLCRFEEGIFSYNNNSKDYVTGKVKVTVSMRKILRKKDPLKSVSEFYCLYPSLYKNNYNYKVKQIPAILRENHKLIEYLNFIFGYNPNEFFYDKKYIYFSSAEDLGENTIDEVEIIKWLIDKLGNENIILKMHPRDQRTVFQNMGITISTDSYIPWEIIQLNQNFEDKIFLTLASGSVIGATTMLNDDIQAFLLYPMVEGNNERFDTYCNQHVLPVLKEVQRKGYCSRFKVVKNCDDITIT